MASKVSRFFRKYFLEGQKLDEKQKQAIETLPEDAPLTTKILVKHRRLIGIFCDENCHQEIYHNLIRNIDTSHLL